MAEGERTEPEPGDAQASSEEALRLLMAYRPYLMTFIVSMVRDFSLAEELCQDVWVAACERWPRHKPGADFGTWVREIARRRTMALLRARAKPGLPPPSDNLVDEIERAIDALSATSKERWEQRKEALRACFRTLPLHLRQLVEMRYAADLSNRRIAQALGREAEAIEVALARARLELEQGLQRRLKPQGEAP